MPPMEEEKAKRQQLNLQKLLLYVSVTDNDLPTISLSSDDPSTVATELRIYFNDEQLTIKEDKVQGSNYLGSQDFEDQINGILDAFGYEVEQTGRQWGFLEFLQYWIKNSEGIQVNYEVYDELFVSGVKSYLESLVRVVARRTIIEGKPKIPQPKRGLLNQRQNDKSMFGDKKNRQSKDSLSKSSISKTSINQKCGANSQAQEVSDSFNYYLQKFFGHYSKKSANTIKTHEFEKLEHFYTTLNLTKFMTYCKEVGLLKAHRTVTVKYIQQLFVKNQDERKVVEYQTFAKIVKEVLVKIFRQELLEAEGYDLIGVKNRENFVQKMKTIGVCVPIKKVIFAKPKKPKLTSPQYAQELKNFQQLEAQRLEQEKQNVKKAQLQQKNGGYQHAYENAWHKIHSPPKQNFLPLIVPNNRPNSKVNNHLEELLELDDEDDPYLRRFKKLIEKSEDADETDKSSFSSAGGVIRRMQKRMENVVKRVR